MVYKINFAFLIICCFSISIYAQSWFPNEVQNPNFYEIQRNFNAFWEGKKIEKGKGYKQFKRWEWYWEKRVKSDGSFYPAGITKDNFNEYLRSKSNNRSTPNVTKWESAGPSSTNGGYAGTGRINALAFHPSNSNIIYAGAAGGGLWQSNDGGSTWFTKTDNLATLGVSAILVDPSNPSIIYIGTGDGDGGDNYSVGVLKSTDGGNTFNTTGLNWSTFNVRLLKRMIFDPDNSNIIFAATTDGIYRSADAGISWTQVRTGNFQDIEAKRQANSNIFYASSDNNIYRSTNDGITWNLVQTITNTNRIALAVSPANNDYVYALCSSSSNSGFRGLYRSTDSGLTYIERSITPNILGWDTNGTDNGGQGWYDLVIAVDPLNADIIYTGGVNAWKSTDGGVNWNSITHWYNNGIEPEVHADKHALEWQNNTTLWEGNDGGVYKTSDGGDTYTHYGSGLINSQMYKLGVSQTDAKAITGLQDNGTKYKNNANNWSDVIGGDGMECAIKPNGSSTMYGSLYFGDFQRTTNSGSNWTNISNNIPGGADGNWVTPFVIDPNAPNTIYIGFSQVYKSIDQGNNWASIGNFSNGSNLDYLAIAPSNSAYLYAGKGNAMWRTTNGGGSWTAMTVPTNNVAMVAIHPTNPNIISVVCQNYYGGQKVYRSINGGSTWTNISGTLPNIPANCLVYYEDSNEGLFVGMDIGIYYRDNDMTDWELVNDGLPNVEISELEINYFNNKLYASTYGRGLWSSNLLGACNRPQELYMSAVSPFSATFSWNNIIAPANGYEWALTTSNVPPASGTFTSATSIENTNLISGQNYFFYVRANCGGSNFSTWAVYNFKHKYICSGNNFDSGGSGGNYSDREDFIDVICPSTSDSAVKLTFNSFNVEATWDAVYIHNGKSINDAIFPSNNPATQAGFPAGGYYGTNIIGPFTSTDSTGCLTIHLLTDDSDTRAGWSVAASCVTLCSPNGITNINNDGWGSIRRAVLCSSANDTIDVSPGLTGQTILLNSPILINKNLSIIQSAASYFKVKATADGPIFNIVAGSTFSLKYLDLYAGTGTKGRAISNSGTLNLSNIKVFEHPSMPSNGSLIYNLGNLNLINDNQIMK